MDNQQNSGGIPNLPYDEYHDFNHYWNIELCIQRCINLAANPEEYVNAVDQFEATLISDLDDKLYQRIKALSDQQEEYLGVEAAKLGYRFKLAREKFRLLYGFMKRRTVSKAVLAIGRPKCHACGALILWNRKEREEAKQEAKKNAGGPTGTPVSEQGIGTSG